MSDPRIVGSIEELVALVSLQEVRVYELRSTAKGPAGDQPGEPTFVIEYARLDSPELIEDRFRFTVETDDAEFLTDLAVIHALDKPGSASEAIRIDFAERVSFMVAFPYIRESVTTNAARLGKRAPLLDLMRPGDFTINLEPPSAQGEQVTTQPHE